jgi:hypothetical protein
MTEPPEDHLKALWKGQETETTPMSVDAIHERVAVFQRRTRRRFLLTIGLCVLAGASYVGSFIWLSPNEVIRLGWGICLIGAGWMAFRSRDRWPVAQPPEESSAVALVSFHRAQLIRQKLRAGSFLVTAGPLLLGIAVAFVGLGIQAGDAWIARLAPIGMLFGIWLVAFLFIVHRQVRRWRRELDEVDATPRG